MLNAQIQEAQELFDTKPGSSADLNAFQDRYNLWREFTIELLTRVFDSPSFAHEFNASGEYFIGGGYETLAEEVESYVGWVRAKKLTLESLVKRLPLIDEVPRLGQAAHPAPVERKPSDPKAVFVVHGQNGPARDAMFAFLRSLQLHPLEWGEARGMTGQTSPYIGDILEAGFARAQALLVLFTGDDEAKLSDKFLKPSSPLTDRYLTPQARPNVLFEAGMAMGRHPDRTILVELGPLRPFSDIAGRHVVRLDDTAATRQELVQRLRTAGCDLNDRGADWLSQPCFEDTI